MPRRVSALDSLGRKDWTWIVFDGYGQPKARGESREGAITRAERAEGRTHKAFMLVKNTTTGERWNRFSGSWWPEDEKVKA